MGKELWMWLADALGYGAVNIGEVLEAYPEGPQAIVQNLGSEQLDSILTQRQAEKLATTRPEDFALKIAHAESMGITALPYDDPLYPDMLRHIGTPPIMLFVKGDLSLLNGQLSIGMVGARRPSAYGVEAVKAIGRGIALGGAIIVSGLAAGLDAEAHKAALAVNGPTIACIAFGHDCCYPASNRKLMEVIERYGAVVSEYPLGTTALRPYFLQRNRLIAGLSHGLIVAEARKYSGTMSTVNFATEYGRDVFAVPGSIFSELSGGTNALIHEGAYVGGSATDILAVYGIELNQEDPVVAASRQAVDGRPLAAPAAATPAWQQTLSRNPADAANHSTFRPLEQQTLGEALQGMLENGGTNPSATPVSSKQAIDAFRRIQQDLPAGNTPAPVDISHNTALDMRAAAVTDDVVFSDFGVHKAEDVLKPEPYTTQAKTTLKNEERAKPEEKVKSFSWDKVEHLSKEDVANSPGQPTNEPAKTKKLFKPKPAIQQRVIKPQKPVQNAVLAQPAPPVLVSAAPALNIVIPPAEPPAPAANPAETPAPLPIKPAAPTNPADDPAPQQKRTARPVSAEPIGRVSSVERLSAVERVAPVKKLSPAARAQAATAAGKSPLSAALNTVVAAAQQTKASAPRKPPPNTDETPSLASKLRTSPPKNEDSPAVVMDFSLPYTAAAGRSAVNAKPRPMPIIHQPKKPAQNIPSSRIKFDDGMSKTLPKNSGLSPAAKKAYAQLGAKPVSLAIICEQSKLTMGDAMAALTELELAGLSRQLAGRQFVIVQ